MLLKQFAICHICKLIILNLILKRHQNWVKDKFADCVDVSTRYVTDGLKQWCSRYSKYYSLHLCCLKSYLIFFIQEYNHERLLKMPLSTVQQLLSNFHWVPAWYSLIHINKSTTLKGFLKCLYQQFNNHYLIFTESQPDYSLKHINKSTTLKGFLLKVPLSTDQHSLSNFHWVPTWLFFDTH